MTTNSLPSTANSGNTSQPIILRGSGLDCIHCLIQDKLVRPIMVNGEMYGSLVDMMSVFAPPGNNPRIYWNQQKRRILAKDAELYQSLTQLKLPAADGKLYKTDVAPLWACVFVVLLMNTPAATDFKKRLAKFAAYEIKYRMMNVGRGLEGFADTIHDQMLASGATMTWDKDDDQAFLSKRP